MTIESLFRALLQQLEQALSAERYATSKWSEAQGSESEQFNARQEVQLATARRLALEDVFHSFPEGTLYALRDGMDFAMKRASEHERDDCLSSDIHHALVAKLEWQARFPARQFHIAALLPSWIEGEYEQEIDEFAGSEEAC